MGIVRMQSMVPILMYHQIDQPPPRGAYLRGATVHPRRFANQMLLLKRLGYQGMSLRNALPYIRGEKQAKVFVLTFDDGYKNVFDYARPILNTVGFTATNFIVSGLIGGRNEWMLDKGSLPAQLMTQDEIQQWHQEGHEIGSHTMDHCYLSQLSAKDQLQQVTQSKGDLEALIDDSVSSFCYPYGDLDERAIFAVKQAGYRCAVATHKGLALNDDNLYALPRVSIIRSNHIVRFYQKVATPLEHKRRTVYW